jgi:hypothetical protein
MYVVLSSGLPTNEMPAPASFCSQDKIGNVMLLFLMLPGLGSNVINFQPPYSYVSGVSGNPPYIGDSGLLSRVPSNALSYDVHHAIETASQKSKFTLVVTST